MDDLRDMNRKLIEIMKIHGAFHPKSDTGRLCLTREKGRRTLILCDGWLQTDAKKTCTWLRKVDLKMQTKSLLCAAQEQALLTK